jgi:diguanylate cyclase (GGDEF)-like protein
MKQNGIWRELGRLCSDLSGITIQIYSDQGKRLDPGVGESALCAYLSRYGETREACLRDCRRKLSAAAGSEEIVSGRCYAGLSYRIVPVRVRGEAPVSILVGKVVTEIFGSGQTREFARRYGLDTGDLNSGLHKMRQLSESELDRVARMVQRFGVLVGLQRRRDASRGRRLRKYRRLLAFTEALWSENGGGTGQRAEAVRFLAEALDVSGAALLVPSREGTGLEVTAAAGIDGALRERLEGAELDALLAETDAGSPLVLADLSLPGAKGRKKERMPLLIHRLGEQSEEAENLLLLGDGIENVDRESLSLGCRLLTSRIRHDRSEADRGRTDSAFSVAARAGQKIFASRKVEKILPQALEEAMHLFRARRGSILLADRESGKVTGAALRGDHAGLSGKITTLQPDSVSHKVFFEKKPMLVLDSEREFQRATVREYPYSTRSFISAPLRENGHALGVLHITDREGGRPYTPGDLALLEMVSGQAAAAISLARLKDDIKSYRQKAVTDSLTGLYNRRHLDDSLAGELERANRFEQPFSLIMFDIDDFKVINDTFGHPCGDRILKELAVELERNTRSIDILSRYGGEEFVMVLPGTGAEGARFIAEKIRSHVEAARFSCETSERTRKLTLSAGVSTFPDSSISAEDMLAKADVALRKAKKLGKNLVHAWQEGDSPPATPHRQDQYFRDRF